MLLHWCFDTQPLTGQSRQEVVGVAAATPVVEQAAAPASGVEEPARKASAAKPQLLRLQAGRLQVGPGGTRLALLLALHPGIEPVDVSLAASVHEALALPRLHAVEVRRDVGLAGAPGFGQVALVVAGQKPTRGRCHRGPGSRNRSGSAATTS